MNHHFCVWQRKALAFFTCREQDRCHRGCHTDAHRGNCRLDVVHGVENGETGCHHAAGGVDIEGDIFFRVFRREEEQLRDDEVRRIAVYVSTEKDNALFKEAGIDVVRTLTHRSLLDDHRHEHLSSWSIHM